MIFTEVNIRSVWKNAAMLPNTPEQAVQKFVQGLVGAYHSAFLGGNVSQSGTPVTQPREIALKAVQNYIDQHGAEIYLTRTRELS